MLQLRDYQEKAIEEIRAYYKQTTGTTTFTTKSGDFYSYESNRRVLLQLATGSGKTACFSQMLKLCYQRKTPAIMVVRGAKLVHQAAERLTREGVPHGIWQANNSRRTDEIIQLCSVDTLYRRKIAPKAKFIVIDECHLTNGGSYEWLATHPEYAESFFLGVSATPFSATGLSHVGSAVIYPISIGKLMEKGYLVGAKYYAPYTVNTTGVKKTGGDFNMKSLADRMNEDDEQKGVVDALTTQWQKHGRNKKSILFAVNRQHAKDLGEQLQICGARTGYIDGLTPHAERDNIIAQLENGEIDIITSVGVLTTGVDIPSLDCIFVCRPTASHNLWVQMLGRGTRPFPGKTHFVVIDMTGNTRKLGPIEAELIGVVEPTKAKRDPTTMIRCDFCYAIFAPTERVKKEESYHCPACDGHISDIKRDANGKEIDEADGEISEVIIEDWEKELPELIDFAWKRKYKKGYVFHTIKVKHGEEAALKAWRRLKVIRGWPKKEVHQNIQNLSTTSFLPSAHARIVEYGKMRRARLLQKKGSSDSD